MPSLVTIRDLSIRYRGPALLDGISCQIEPSERIGLLGRNGAGKTTFMRILRGDVEPDRGEISFLPGSKVALLPQDVPESIEGTIRQVVAEGLRESACGVSGRAGQGPEHAEIHDWQGDQAVDQILSRMSLDEHAPFARLSSGMKRRVMLARSLVSSPDLLLLDEPTNHLDIEAIEWLEQFLEGWRGAFLFVTHDRVFLRKLARRILEVDRGRLFDWSCDYDTFLKRKEAMLAAEEQQNDLFDKKLALEEVWIRTGIKARRTRNEGRVRALEELRRVRQDRRTNPGQVKLQIQEAARSGQLVAQLDRVSFAHGERMILKGFSTTILRGDKVGIIGPNGAGKTTLLRILLGQLAPQSGTVRLGTNLQLAYFDQLRQQLNDEATVLENVADGYDTVQVGGQARHAIGYLEDFLFSPERARTPVKFLSGGERNRILLARLFAKPANVIVLDEPTNDLDAETLELLELRLMNFSGTVILVSHDRAFLNNVVTSSIVFENGTAREYVGGYDDWLQQRQAPQEVAASPKRESSKNLSDAPSNQPKRLSYKQQQELAQLPAQIETLEREVAELTERMGRAEFYRQAGDEIAAAQQRLSELEQAVFLAYQKWEELDRLLGN
jgi:ATP-binding cassette subfamily F protein uup